MEVIKKIKLRKHYLVVLISCIVLIGINLCFYGGIKWNASYKDIILVERYMNFAFGYQHRGKYMDKNGYIYEYDFADVVKYPYENNRFPSDQEYLDLIIKESYRSFAFDCGTRTLSAVCSDGSLLKLGSEGDMGERRKSEAANDVYLMWKNFLIKQGKLRI